MSRPDNMLFHGDFGTREIEVKIFRINAVCPKCGDGNLERCAGVVLESNPPWNPHECSNESCDWVGYILGQSFPQTVYREVR